jgi:hypothetical protein
MTHRTRLLVVVLALADVHCHRTAPASPEPAMTDPDAPQLTACAIALRGLAAGDYAAWHGLSDACTTADATAALGAHDGIDRTGFPGGSPTRYRVYPSSAGAPSGLHVYDVDDRIVLVIAGPAQPAHPLVDLLGEPDAKDPSQMPGFKTMWTWAARGLTLHVDDDSGEVAWLYAYAPMTLEAFRASWLPTVEIHRTPVR